MVLETRELQFKNLVAGNHLNDSATLSLLPPSQMNSDAPKPPVRPKNQLTIFYAGSVNVFDDVPEEKAHAIMLLAGNATAGNINQLLGSLGSLVAAQPPTNLSQFSEPAQKVRKLQSMLSPSQNNGTNNNNNNTLLLSLNSHFVRPTTPTFSNSSLPKIACPAVSSQSLPQARKASLTRFLQRRKERALQQSMESGKEEKTNSDFSVQNQSQECSNAVQEGHSALKKENSMGTTIEA